MGAQATYPTQPLEPQFLLSSPGCRKTSKLEPALSCLLKVPPWSMGPLSANNKSWDSQYAIDQLIPIYMTDKYGSIKSIGKFMLAFMGHQFPEVNISPKISISAQPLKMALHKNPAMHGSRIVIFLHESKKTVLFARLKAPFLHDSKVNSLKPARYHIIHCIF